jgi:hypothetical protein
VTVTIDLQDPQVQSLLGTSRQCVQLAGDAPGPEGHPGLLGAAGPSSKQEVVVVYKDTFLTLDVYAIPGEPLKVHLVCPGCQKLLTVRGDRKAIDFAPHALNPMRQRIAVAGARELVEIASIGRISIEPFQCTWEAGRAAHVQGQVHTGATLCKKRLVIEDNRARDA